MQVSFSFDFVFSVSGLNVGILCKKSKSTGRVSQSNTSFVVFARRANNKHPVLRRISRGFPKLFQEPKRGTNGIIIKRNLPANEKIIFLNSKFKNDPKALTGKENR
jgi:hypothetical protein